MRKVGVHFCKSVSQFYDPLLLYLLCPLFKVPVEGIVANVELAILHPLDLDGALPRVEVVLHELGRILNINY